MIHVGMKILDEIDVIKCLISLSDLNPKIVVITSVKYHDDPENLYCYALERSNDRTTASVSRYVVSKIEGNCA